jgi:hypothetical protein
MENKKNWAIYAKDSHYSNKRGYAKNLLRREHRPLNQRGTPLNQQER